MKHLATTLVIASAIALSACAKKAPEDLPLPPAGTGANAGASTVPQNPNAGAQAAPQPGSQPHFVAAMNGRNVIYFDTDQFNIDQQDAAALQAQAQYLIQYPNTRATIEGHCDERGTRDYNIALGERRANAAKNFLVSLGVPANRLSTISYGKERPVALGSNENAWARNRRAATVTISG